VLTRGFRQCSAVTFACWHHAIADTVTCPGDGRAGPNKYGTAGDVDDDASDPVRIVGGEEQRGHGDIFGVPSRRSGCDSANARCVSAGIHCSFVAVRIVSGARQFARMPYGPTWEARSWVKICTPAFAAP
jgi:hypothetical protein